MIAVSCTGLSLCKQPKMKMETTNKHKKLLHEASKPKQIPTSYVSEKIDCSTLDGVLLHPFDSLSDIRAELGLQVLQYRVMDCMYVSMYMYTCVFFKELNQIEFILGSRAVDNGLLSGHVTLLSRI